MKILMVCLGNICRSPLAEGILANKAKHLNVTVESAGTAGYHIGRPPDSRSIEIASRNSINIENQRARQFTRSDFKEFDIIYAMDTSNYSHLIALTNTQEERKKIRMILNEVTESSYRSVPDPYYGDGDGFQKIYNILEEACEKIVKQIE